MQYRFFIIVFITDQGFILACLCNFCFSTRTKGNAFTCLLVGSCFLKFPQLKDLAILNHFYHCIHLPSIIFFGGY